MFNIIDITDLTRSINIDSLSELKIKNTTIYKGMFLGFFSIIIPMLLSFFAIIIENDLTNTFYITMINILIIIFLSLSIISLFSVILCHYLILRDKFKIK
jgi:hypothetical protein